MGEIRFRNIAKCMIRGNFQKIEAEIAIRFYYATVALLARPCTAHFRHHLGIRAMYIW